MKAKYFYPIVLLASILIAILISCDVIDPPDSIEPDGVSLAPANADQKVYVIPATQEYHLANCPHLTPDKTVMWKSEAVEQGYNPCEYCFPSPPEPLAPHVYVMEGESMYHLAGCPLLDDTKTAIPKSDAIEQGYTPCLRCNSDVPPGVPHVYVNPGETVYHRALCPNLADDKLLMPKAEAIEQGYTPCPECAITERIPGAIVYICPDYGEVYHGAGCSYLEECNRVEAVTIWEAYSRGFTPCDRCNGKPPDKEP